MLRLVIGHRVVPVGTTHLWMLRVRAHHSSVSVHLPLLVGARSGVVAALCLHTIRVKALAQVVESLLQREPSSWLRFLHWAITAVCFLS